MKKVSILLILFSQTIVFTSGAILPHQGRVLISSTAFEGTGLFRFALVNEQDELVWNHLGGVGVPDNYVELQVEDGFYRIRLGDPTVSGMAALPDDLLLLHPKLSLRIWFNDGVNGTHQLGSDQPLPVAASAVVSDHTRNQGMLDGMLSRISYLENENNQSLVNRIESMARRMDDLNNSLPDFEKSSFIPASNFSISKSIPTSDGGTFKLDKGLELTSEIDGQNLRLTLNDRGQMLEASIPLSELGSVAEVEVDYRVMGENKGISLSMNGEELAQLDAWQSLAENLTSHLNEISMIDSELGRKISSDSEAFFSAFQAFHEQKGGLGAASEVVEKAQSMVLGINRLGSLLDQMESMEKLAGIARVSTSESTAWDSYNLKILRNAAQDFASSLATQVNGLVNPSDDPESYVFGFESILGPIRQGANRAMEENYGLFGVEGNGKIELFADEVDLLLPYPLSDRFTMTNSTTVYPNELKNEPNAILVRGSDELGLFLQDPSFFKFEVDAKRMRNIAVEIDLAHPGEDQLSGTIDDGRSIMLAYEEIPFRIELGSEAFLLGDNFFFDANLTRPDNLAATLRLDPDFTPARVQEIFAPIEDRRVAENPKLNESLEIDFKYPQPWERLRTNSLGDIVFYEDMIWESQIDSNVNHRPREVDAVWKELPGGYTIGSQDWILMDKGSHNRQYFMTPDGQFFDLFQDAYDYTQNILLSSLTKDYSSHDELVADIQAMVKEVTIPFRRFEAEGSSSRGVVIWDFRTQRYQLWAAAPDGVIFNPHSTSENSNEDESSTHTRGNAVRSYDPSANYYLGDIVPSTDPSVLFFQANSDLDAWNHTLTNSAQFSPITTTDIPNAGSSPNEAVPQTSPTEIVPNSLPGVSGSEEIGSVNGSVWHSSDIYNSGDIVFYRGQYYQCLKDNFNNFIEEGFVMGRSLVVHPDDEFFTNDRNERVPNDFWSPVGPSLQYVLSFTLRPSVSPNISIASAGSNGMDAEAEPVLDASGKLIGLRVDNPGRYAFATDSPAPVPPEFEKAFIIYEAQSAQIPIIWGTDSQTGNPQVSGFDFSGLSPLNLEAENVSHNLTFRLLRSHKAELTSHEDSSLAHAVARLDESAIVPEGFLGSAYFSEAKNQAAFDLGSLEALYPHAPGRTPTAPVQEMSPTPARSITLDMLSAEVIDKLENNQSSDVFSPEATAKITALEDQLEKALNRIDTLEITKSSGGISPMILAQLGYRQLPDANLTGVNLSSVILRKADYSGAQLQGANLTGTDFTEANLTRANLSSANLNQAILRNAELTYIDLTGANLKEAIFAGANLNGSDLSSANLEKADFSNTSLAMADLGDADLYLADFTRADLNGSNLLKADLTQAILSNTSFRQADLRGVQWPSGLVLNLTDFMGAKLSDPQHPADLNGSILDGNFSGFDFSKFSLTNTELRGIFQDANFSHAQLQGSSVPISNEAENGMYNFSHSDFSEANLSGSVFGRTHSVYVQTGYSPGSQDAQILPYPIFGYVDFYVSADFSRGDFRNADLSNAILTGADFGGAKLANVNLNGANLTDADLTGANLDGANLTGTIFSNTIMPDGTVRTD